MVKTKTSEFTEINDIKDDLQALKSDTVALTRHLKEEGAEQLSEIKERAKERVQAASVAGKSKFFTLEEHVRSKPAQSLLIAFGVGMIASYLCKRRHD